MNLVTIKESHFASDLSILKTRLEAAGIKCYLKNELTSQVLNHIPAMLVELQVSLSDLEKVKEIMKKEGDILFK